jgi:hypothetical protein
MRRVVGTVRDRAHHGEGNAEIVADLCQRRAFHLDRERVGEPLAQFSGLARAGDEAVAADHHAGVDPRGGDAERA